MPAYFPFVFFLAPRDRSRPLRVFQHRDVTAMLELSQPIARQGYAYGGVLLNFPPPPGAENGSLLAVETNALAGDLVLTTGRPPLYVEEEEDEIKRLRRADTDLERAIVAAWLPHFRLLTRGNASLANDHRSALPPDYADRRHIEFYLRHGAGYKQLSREQYRGEPRTAAFLLRVRELWPGGPGYIGIFGMDGTMSLIWAYLLRTRHFDLLGEDGFAMVELSGSIPQRPTSLAFADAWQSKVLLQQRF